MNELEYYLDREYKKLSLILKDAKIKKGERFIKAYWEDIKYFYQKGEKVKAFELVMYIWGILDCLYNTGYLEINPSHKKWFKDMS